MTNPLPRPAITHERIGGWTLRTAHWRPAEPSTKRPLLFFNGIGANIELAFGLGEHIRDREILTFDVPGVGGSPPAALPYRPWQLARAAAKLSERFGFDDLDVMGVSWGGAMAQQFAFQYRNRVKRVILAATSAGSTMVPGKASAISKMRDPRRYADPDYMVRNFQILYGDEATVEGAAAHTNALQSPHPRGYAYQLLCMLGWSSLPFLRLMRQPTLVMAGDRDTLVPMANARILNFMLPNGRLHVVEDGGHLFLVTKASEVLPAITDFLDEIHVEHTAFDDLPAADPA